ncbi:MAG: glycosyltransferase family 2 protein [Planctomycetota bacterium]
MKISIITASYNSAATIDECLRSVEMQQGADIEHIVVDGGSTDGTLEILQSHPQVKYISEPDRGMYDALNKGIRLATGDYIGTLGADDVLADDSVLRQVSQVCQTTNCDCCYGDLLIVDRENMSKVIRRWNSGKYSEGRCLYGWAPPHLALFLRRELFSKLGPYRLDLKISSDYELMLRFIHFNRLECVYLPVVVVRMRTGGTSTKGIRNQFTQFGEDIKAWRVNSHPFPLFPVMLKKMSKLRQFL